MRIVLRPSGGRGEYELAGRQGDIQASALFNHPLFYELTPNIIIPGRAFATRVQGKPRIRLQDRQSTTHFYLLLAGVLLLPKPIRELRETHGRILLKHESYSMTAIKVDVGSVDSEKVILRPTDLLIENADQRKEQVDLMQRMLRVTRLWETASGQGTPLAELIRNHMQAVLDPNPDHKHIESAAKAISDELQTEGDALPLAEKQCGIADENQEAIPPPERQTLTHQAEFGEDDDASPAQARIQRVKQWRQLAVRGSAGSKFRKDVANSYEYRCIFTGQRLPRLEVTDSAGVDSAHILPWSTHDINSVRNGLCLNKQCHWALDEGVLRLTFDKSSSTYLVELPVGVRNAAKKASFDLDYFKALTGPVPASRLPKDKALWPSPKYIEELNRFMLTT